MPLEFSKKEKKQIQEIVLPILEKLRRMQIEAGLSSCWIEEVQSVENTLSGELREDSEK
jgi:hypothetical protein